MIYLSKLQSIVVCNHPTTQEPVIGDILCQRGACLVVLDSERERHILRFGDTPGDMLLRAARIPAYNCRSRLYNYFSSHPANPSPIPEKTLKILSQQRRSYTRKLHPRSHRQPVKLVVYGPTLSTHTLGGG